eukprot:1140360-Pelagomonas_calceolata.AAC.1
MVPTRLLERKDRKKNDLTPSKSTCNRYATFTRLFGSPVLPHSTSELLISTLPAHTHSRAYKVWSPDFRQGHTHGKYEQTMWPATQGQCSHLGSVINTNSDHVAFCSRQKADFDEVPEERGHWQAHKQGVAVLFAWHCPLSSALKAPSTAIKPYACAAHEHLCTQISGAATKIIKNKQAWLPAPSPPIGQTLARVTIAVASICRAHSEDSLKGYTPHRQTAPLEEIRLACVAIPVASICRAHSEDSLKGFTPHRQTAPLEEICLGGDPLPSVKIRDSGCDGPPACCPNQGPARLSQSTALFSPHI